MKYIREIEIGSKLYSTVERKVSRNETITFTNGETGEKGVYNITGGKAGRPGFVNISLERVDNMGFTL